MPELRSEQVSQEATSERPKLPKLHAAGRFISNALIYGKLNTRPSIRVSSAVYDEALGHYDASKVNVVESRGHRRDKLDIGLRAGTAVLAAAGVTVAYAGYAHVQSDAAITAAHTQADIKRDIYPIMVKADKDTLSAYRNPANGIDRTYIRPATPNGPAFVSYRSAASLVVMRALKGTEKGDPTEPVYVSANNRDTTLIDGNTLYGVTMTAGGSQDAPAARTAYATFYASPFRGGYAGSWQVSTEGTLTLSGDTTAGFGEASPNNPGETTSEVAALLSEAIQGFVELPYNGSSVAATMLSGS